MISVVLPCYNESANLKELFQRLDLLTEKNSEIEIVLVNNGSTDNSKLIFDLELEKRNRNQFTMVEVDINIGYGYGILSGLRRAKGEILAITHADHQTDPLDVLKAFEIYQKNPEAILIKGYRRNRKVSEALFSYGMALLASIVLETRLTEINAQPKMFTKSFFNSIDQNAPNDFSLDLFILYQAKKTGKIIDFPVYFAKRTGGEAKGGSGSSWKQRYKLIKRSFHYIFELRSQLKL